MATIRKRGERWQALVKRGGKQASKTFTTKTAAMKWAAMIEREAEEAGLGIVPNKTFGDLLERYSREVSPKKRGHVREVKAIDRLLLDELAKVSLRELAPRHIAAWRDRRLMEVQPSTVNRELNILSHACQVAVKEWQWLAVSPTSAVTRPKDPLPRKRRPQPDEIAALIQAGGYEPQSPPAAKTARVIAAFLFAMETGMRQGEIAGLTRANTHAKHVHLPMTKNGTARDVPLTGEARRILDQVLALGHDPVFGLEAKHIDALFRKTRGRAGIEGLTFHDSRHEALTRLSRIFSAMELAKIAGIRDLAILQRVYFNPTVEELADRLG
jgi:integrase